MPHFYFVVKAIQQEPLLVEWLRFHLSDSGEILSVDTIRWDKENHSTIKNGDENSPSIITGMITYDPSIIRQNKKVYIQSQSIDTEKPDKLLRYPAASENDFFIQGETWTGHGWNKAIANLKAFRTSQRPSANAQLDWIEAQKERKEMIDAQYQLLQNQFSQEKQEEVSDDIVSSLPTITKTIPEIEKVIQLSQQFIEALSKESNPLSVLANMMDGTNSSLGFSATILTLLRRKIKDDEIIKSSFPARFLKDNACDIHIVTEAYQLLKELAEIQDNAVIDAEIKANIRLFCDIANGYGITFSIPYEWSGVETSIRGFEGLSLSGAVTETEIVERISSYEKLPFALTLSDENFQRLFGFFKEKLLYFLLTAEQKKGETLYTFVSKQINDLSAESIIALYETIVMSALNEDKETVFLSRLCDYLTKEKAVTLFEKEPHAFHWVLAQQKNLFSIMSENNKNALHDAIKSTLTINNVSNIIWGVFRSQWQALTDRENITLSTILSFLLEHPECEENHLIRSALETIFNYDAVKKWMDLKEQELINRLKEHITRFVSNPTRESYTTVDDEYKTYHAQYQWLNNHHSNIVSCPTSKDELHALIITELLMLQPESVKLGNDELLFLKPCVDAIFSDFDSLYLEKESQVNARKAMLAFCFKRHGVFNNFRWVTQLEAIFDPNDLWSFLQIKDDAHQSFLSCVVHDEKFLLRFFEKIANHESLVFDHVIGIDTLEQLFSDKIFFHLSFSARKFIFLALEKCIPSLTLTQLVMWKEKVGKMMQASCRMEQNELFSGTEEIFISLKKLFSGCKEKRQYEEVVSLLSFQRAFKVIEEKPINPISRSQQSMPILQTSRQPLLRATDLVGGYLPFKHRPKNILSQLFTLLPTIEDRGKILSLLCKNRNEDGVINFFDLIEKEWLNTILFDSKNLVKLGRLLSYVDDEYTRKVVSGWSLEFLMSVNILLNFTDLIEPLNDSQRAIVCEELSNKSVFSDSIAWDEIWIDRDILTAGHIMYTLYEFSSDAVRTLGVSKFLRLFLLDEIGGIYQSYCDEMRHNTALDDFEWLDILSFLDVSLQCVLLQELILPENYHQFENLKSYLLNLLNDIKLNHEWNERSASILSITGYFETHPDLINVLFEKILSLLSVERQNALMDSISKDTWVDILKTKDSISYFLKGMQCLKKDFFESLWDKVQDHVMVVCTGDCWNDIMNDMPKEQKAYIITRVTHYFQQELILSKSPPLNERYPQYSDEINHLSVIAQMLKDCLKPLGFLQGMMGKKEPHLAVRKVTEGVLRSLPPLSSELEKNEKTEFNIIRLLLSIREQGGNRGNNKLYRRCLYAIDMLAKISSRVASVGIIEANRRTVNFRTTR